MGKTIKEWLSELPEPYKTEAIEGAERLSPDLLGVEVDSLSEAIFSMFDWTDSKQGANYWERLYSHYYFIGG